MTAEPRDVEEIRADLAAWRGKPPGEGAETRRRFLDIVSSRLVADVEPLLARLAAADRENAELRGANERLAQTAIEANAQLAAAQAQLAEAQSALAQGHARLGEVKNEAFLEGGRAESEKRRAEAAEARLEAVRALVADARANHEASDIAPFVFADEIAAALSAAPQPEPDVRAENLRRLRQRPCCRDHADATPEPPASDEPARCEHERTEAHAVYYDTGRGWDWAGECPGPAASGTPDGGLS